MLVHIVIATGKEANKNALGKDLPAQAIAIIPKMRELDEFLQKISNE